MQTLTRAELLSDESFSLSLSSGFFGFFAHLGFYKAFERHGLKPQALSGSSAGALVAAGVASGLSSSEMQELFLSINKNDFWDPRWGWGFLAGDKFESLLKQHYVESFSDLKTPLHISVFNIHRRKTEVLTSGSVAAAVRASSAVPLFFHPVKISENRYWDGGVRDRAGVKGVIGHSLTPVVHYLDAQGLMSSIEDRFFYRQLHGMEHFFKIQNPFKMGPNTLMLGKDVIHHFDRETTQWLAQKLPAKNPVNNK